MNVSYRISTVTAGFILACTLLVDGIGILLTLTLVGSIVAAFIGAITAFMLWLTFMLHGVKYTGTAGLRKVGIMLVTAVGEVIPIVGALPLATTGAALVILQTRVEDRVEAEKKAKEQKELAKQQEQLRVRQLAATRAANDNQRAQELAA